MSSTSIILGIIFGSIGFGYFIYGKKQQSWVAYLSGALLMVFPYFVENIIWAVLIGLLLMALPFFMRD